VGPLIGLLDQTDYTMSRRGWLGGCNGGGLCFNMANETEFAMLNPLRAEYETD